MEAANLSKRNSRQAQFGNGRAEYILIVTLIVIGSIGVYNLFGRTLPDQDSNLACGLVSNQTCSMVQSPTNAQTQADPRHGATK